MIQKGSSRARHTHFLETVEEGTCQDTERNRPSKAHSLSGDSRERYLSGHRKKLTKAHSLPGDGRGRNSSGHGRNETGRVRGTHVLETAEGEICQDTEKNRPSKAHSLPGDGRGRDLSGHGTKPTERGAPTN